MELQESDRHSCKMAVGNPVKVKVVKNKMAPPFRIATFDIMFSEGISKRGEIIDIGVETNVIVKSGSWFSYEGTKIAQGREGAKQFLADNPEVALEIEKKIVDKYQPILAGPSEADADVGDDE